MGNFFEKPQLEILRPDWPAPENVDAFFTYRSGGVSAGSYGGADGFNGLNLGNHVGDSPYCVRKNREIVESLGCKDLRFMTQVHSTRVVNAKDIESDKVEADASWTNVPMVGSVVMVADCLPILFCSEDGEVVSACHAGWRGLADGVIDQTVQVLRQNMQNPSTPILAWMGPRLGKDDFFVRQDVKDIFSRSALGAYVDECFKPKGDGYLFDFGGMAQKALKQSGIDKIYDCGLSTFADPEHFYSYRRDKVTGRHGAVIYKKY